MIVFAVHHLAEPALVNELPRIAAAASGSGARLGFVGGASSTLVTESGPRVVDTPEFAEEWKPEALAGAVLFPAGPLADAALARSIHGDQANH